MGEIKTNVDSSININSFSVVGNKDDSSLDLLVNNNNISVDTLDLTADTLSMANEGSLSKENIDFSRISATAGDAKNGNFISQSKINDSYWGDNGELTYKIRDDGTIMIFENDTLLGFTDRLNSDNTVTEKVVDEVVSPVKEETVVKEVAVEEENPNQPIDLVYRQYTEPVINNSSLDNYSIVTGMHYTTGNTTYPMSDEDFYKVLSCVEAESSGDYEDALAVASVIANRIDDGRFSETTPLGIVSHPGQFAAWNASRAENYAANPALCQNPDVIKACQDVFYNGIRNNDYVEFKAASSPDKSVTGEVKYQFVEGGNKFHNLAQSLDRVEVHLASTLNQVPIDTDNVSV